MGPRLDSRGRVQNLFTTNVIFLRFNGAAAGQPRKAKPCERDAAATPRFNGAAAGQPRKV